MPVSMSRRHFIGAGTLGLSLTGAAGSAAEKRRPNIILMVADDLGYGDLGCYGQQRFPTPHLDRMAASGIRFRQHYSGCTVCAPSRSALMTGQHTGHTPIRGNMEIQPEGQAPLPDSAVTVAGLLRHAGYATGAFGKWGLGSPGSSGDPNRQGFDEFFGYNCQRLAHNYYPWHLWHNKEKMVLRENEGDHRGIYAPELIQKRALQFMETHRRQPFFLFIPTILPHAELIAPEPYMAKFRGRFLPEKAFQGVDDGPNFRTGGYASQNEAHAAYAAMITYLDDQVGAIMAQIRSLELEENTLFLFSSDNGPHREGGGDPDYFGSCGPLRGNKRDLYEGGIRTPLIACWKGRIKPAGTTDHLAAFWDFLPTACDLAGITAPGNIDGISYLPKLLGKNQQGHDFLYWEFHEGKSTAQAVRMGRWKAVRQSSQSPMVLYDLNADIGETKDLAAKNPEVIATITAYLKTARIDSAGWPFKP